MSYGADLACVIVNLDNLEDPAAKNVGQRCSGAQEADGDLPGGAVDTNFLRVAAS